MAPLAIDQLMDSDRWQKLKLIFDEAVLLGDAERASFLADSCGNDVVLREEIEALLSSHLASGDFMQEPAAREVAGLIVNDGKPDPGERIGPYEIVLIIGVGGMGEVYLAKDTRLDRKVALKLLSTQILEDEDRVGRFRQEAFATSALNHPNIVTIYEIGKWNGRDYIATEFIEGETLRTILKGKSLSISEALGIGIQITNALSAAHGAGIVHRDIKPENIMIRPDGLLKVLDFGIAKYSPREGGGKALIETKIGEVIGTVAYMSPEQARGLEIDSRTDIWSVGVILYEMIAGRLPFAGETRSDRIAAILEHTHPPIDNLRNGIPPSLGGVIDRALAKRKDERYQAIEHLAADLEDLHGETRIEKKRVFRLPGIWSYRKSILGYTALAFVILILAAASFVLYLTNRTASSAVPSAVMKITRLSDTSQAADVAISPDGEFIAFIKLEAGRQSLWLRQTSATSSIQIVPANEDVRLAAPAFSADGNYVYYLRAPLNSSRATLHQVPKLGGAERSLVDNISLEDSGSNFSLSPDGGQVAFIRLDDGMNRSLVIADVDGANSRQLAARSLPEFLTGAAWSPDGSKIACYAGMFGGKGGRGKMSVQVINVNDGSEGQISRMEMAEAEGLTWLADSSGLILSAAEKPGINQLWIVSSVDGSVRRVTNDLSDYAAPSLASRSSTLAVVQINQTSNIWAVSPSEKEPVERQLTFENGGSIGEQGVSMAPDGSIVYTSQSSGNSDLWIVSPDGLSNRQITVNSGTNTFPFVSPDGRHIVFNSDRRQPGEIWRCEIDGRDPRPLTTGSYPTFSPDGKWIHFYRTGTLWRIPAEGGEPVQIPTNESDKITASVVSPDNSMIAANYLVGEPNAHFRLAVMLVDGGPPIKVFDIPTYAIKTLRWGPSGRAISFVSTLNEVSNVFDQSLDGKKPSQVTRFRSGRIWSFDWSFDKRTLALARGSITRDVVLISDYK